MKIKCVLIILLIIISTDILAYYNKSRTEILSQTYGYLFGQDKILTKIEKKFPRLSNEIYEVELKFDKSFSKAKKNITFQMQKILESRFNEYKIYINNKLSRVIETQYNDELQAKAYINEIENRANGIIESPFLETILTYQFIDNPENEFTRGFVKPYSTKDHSKSKGMTISAKMPISWRKEEGDRTNIINRFTSENGKGLEIIMFMVKDLAIDFELSEDYKYFKKNELNDFLFGEKFNQLFGEYNNSISDKQIVLDGYISREVVFKDRRKRLDIDINTMIVHYLTYIDGKLVSMQCAVSSLDESSLEDRFNLFLPLFKKIAISIVFPDQYQETSIDESLNENKQFHNEDIKTVLNKGIIITFSFLVTMLFFVIYKTIYWFKIRTNINEIVVKKAMKNIVILGKVSIIWAFIQIFFAIVFIESWGMINFSVTLFISSLTIIIGYKLSKTQPPKFYNIFFIFFTSLIFSLVFPLISILQYAFDPATLGNSGFLLYELFHETQIVRFGGAYLTYALLLQSTSGLISFQIIRRNEVQENTISIYD